MQDTGELSGPTHFNKDALVKGQADEIDRNRDGRCVHSYFVISILEMRDCPPELIFNALARVLSIDGTQEHIKQVRIIADT